MLTTFCSLHATRHSQSFLNVIFAVLAYHFFILEDCFSLCLCSLSSQKFTCVFMPKHTYIHMYIPNIQCSLLKEEIRSSIKFINLKKQKVVFIVGAPVFDLPTHGKFDKRNRCTLEHSKLKQYPLRNFTKT